MRASPGSLASTLGGGTGITGSEYGSTGSVVAVMPITAVTVLGTHTDHPGGFRAVTAAL